MRRLSVVLLFLAAACTTAPEADDDRVSTSVTAAPSTTITTDPSTTTSTTSTTSTTIPGDPVALITPTGVPVAITETLDAGHWVLTPCGYDQFVTGGTPLHGATVVIDPGHGGPSDTGSVGQNGLQEKVVNLRVARLTAEILNNAGFEAVLTRTDDYASPLFVRANLADSLDAEVMVSIHHNGPTPGPSEEPGTEVFVQEGSDASARLGGLLWESAREGLGIFDVPWAAAEDAGVMTVLNSRGSDAYGILRHPETTTVLVELGYMSNPPEAELFASPLYPRIAAKAVAGAVTSYLESEENIGSGFVEGRVFNPNPGIGQDACTDPDLG